MKSVSTKSVFSPLHVLVVDPRAESRALACTQLQDMGHQATAMPSRAAASEWLRKNAADVILLDWDPSETAALDAEIPALADAPETWQPVILVSDMHMDPAPPLPRRADDWMRRPLDAAALGTRLQRLAQVLAQQRTLGSLVQQQRDILDNILDAVMTLDENGVVVEANLAACRTFKAGAPASLIGAEVRMLTGHDLATLVRTPRLQLQRGDGGSFTAQVSASSWEESGAMRVTLVIRDLTEMLRNERMRDEFLATVSHELRTPLTSVLGAVGLLASGAAGALPAPALPLAAAAQRNGERLSKLIDDVLDLTKLEGDRIVLHPRDQALAPLMQEAIAANLGYANRAGVGLRLELDESAQAVAHVDADRLLQVMANLLSNAIKHSPAGAAVVLRLHALKGGHAIEVSDSGPGIPEVHRAFLFDKFFQADTGDGRAIGGTGLGLHIARLLIERMAGSIEALPSEGRGATFRVWLPAAAVRRAGEPAGEGRHAPAVPMAVAVR